MGIYANDVQKLYIAYFNRPADPVGLAYWEEQITKNGGSTAAVANAFSASNEYKSLFAGKSSAQIVDTIYQNLFGRSAEPSGLTYWAVRLENGTFNVGNIAVSILVGAQNDDKKVVDNKVTVATSFTTALDTTAEILAYSGDTAAAAARNFLKTVAATDASLTAAKAAVDSTITSIANTTVANGSTFTLTVNQDSGKDFTGGAGNDTFNAGIATDGGGNVKDTLQNFDALDGGEGTDTLNVTLNTNTLVTPTLRNIENVNVRVTTAGGDIDFVGSTGVSKVTVENSTAATGVIDNVGTASLAVKNQKTAVSFDHSTATALNLTVENAGTVSASAPVEVAIDLGAATASKATTLNIVASGSNVAVKDSTGGSVATTVNIDASGSNTIKLTDGASSATTVSLTGSGSVDLTGATLSAIKTLTVADGGVKAAINNQTAAAVTVTTGGGADTITASGAGVKSISTGAGKDAVTIGNAAQATLAAALAGATVTGAADEAAAIVVVQGLTAAAVTAGTITAAQKTAIDAAANTATDTPAATAAAAAALVTGYASASGVLAATATVDLGAGDDSLTLGGAFAEGATLIGGDGTDTLGLAKADYATVAAYAPTSLAKVTGFEVLSITNALANGDSIDVSKITGIGSFTAAAGVATGESAAVTNLGANSTVTLAGAAANNGTLTVSLKTDTSADALTLVLNKSYVDNNDATVDAVAHAHTVVAADIENLTINSTGKINTFTPVDGYKADLVTNTVTLDGSNKLATVTVTGNQALNFTSTAAMTKLATIDASANTGGLTFSGANADMATPTTSVAMTIKGSATAANNLTGSGHDDTIIGGSGKDTIQGGAGADTLTGGAGNDTFVFAAATDSTLAKLDVITDFSANTVGNTNAVNGGANSGANATATLLNGDVLKFNVVEATITKVDVSVQANAADAQTYIQNVANSTTDTFVAVLDSSSGKLYVDLDSNGSIDSVIQLTGVTTITHAAFVLY